MTGGGIFDRSEDVSRLPKATLPPRSTRTKQSIKLAPRALWAEPYIGAARQLQVLGRVEEAGGGSQPWHRGLR